MKKFLLALAFLFFAFSFSNANTIEVFDTDSKVKIEIADKMQSIQLEFSEDFSFAKKRDFAEAGTFNFEVISKFAHQTFGVEKRKSGFANKIYTSSGGLPYMRG